MFGTASCLFYVQEHVRIGGAGRNMCGPFSRPPCQQVNKAASTRVPQSTAALDPERFVFHPLTLQPKTSFYACCPITDDAYPFTFHEE